MQTHVKPIGAEHFVVGSTNYWLNGLGQGCCYQDSNYDGVPDGSLRYLMANTDLDNSIDDDGYEVGVNGTIGGFTGVKVSTHSMAVTVRPDSYHIRDRAGGLSGEITML